MSTRSTFVLLSMTTLTGAFMFGSSLEGCGSSTSPGTGAGATSTSTTTSSHASSGTGGNANVTIATIQDLTDSTSPTHVGPGTPVEIKGAVAMSIKFKVSKSSSGSCLWGVFLSAPGLTTTAANTGVLALSYGSQAVANDAGVSYCPVPQAGQPAGDAFPDDIQPGDVVDVIGETDAYVPSTCSAADAGVGATNVKSIQLNKVTTVTRTSTGGPVPAAYTLTASDLTTLAAGSDETWLDKWGGVLVQADNVTAESQGGSLTDAYGHMLLQAGTNGIEVGDALYYVGYVKSTDACYSGPSFSTAPPINFTSIRGFVYLDYCNWSLAPRDKCNDIAPPSIDCASIADAGADASAASVCTHEPTDFSDGG